MRIFEDLPNELCIRLHQMSINEAISQGLIDDIGDDEGNLIFEDPDNPGKYFAIIQKCKIQCSDKLMEEYLPEEISNIVGDLSFFRWVGDGKEHFRLARPRYLNLGDPVVTIKIAEESNSLHSSVQHIIFHPRNEPPENPRQGMTYYDCTANRLRCFDGRSWRDC